MGRNLKLNGVHHVAYRCRDTKQTVDFYERVLGMEFMLAIAEDRVPSTGEPNPYMHVFLDAGRGNVLAFFELPGIADMDRDRNTPTWVQHLAFDVPSYEALLEAKSRAEGDGLEVVGPTDHGIFQSIYFFDPNGHRLELAWNCGTPEQYAALKSVAVDMLDEWTRTRRPPRHSAWLHDPSHRDRNKSPIGSD